MMTEIHECTLAVAWAEPPDEFSATNGSRGVGIPLLLTVPCW